MVIVGPKKHHNLLKKNGFSRRHSYGGSPNLRQKPENFEPAIDFPVQFNFGSPYSSSLTIFFDFQDEVEHEKDQAKTSFANRM